MNTHNKLGALASLLVLGLSTAPSSALVIMISDLVPGSGGNIETFLSTNFTNVTEIRHANYANFAAAGTQDALNGTGAFAGGGAADPLRVKIQIEVERHVRDPRDLRLGEGLVVERVFAGQDRRHLGRVGRGIVRRGASGERQREGQGGG